MLSLTVSATDVNKQNVLSVSVDWSYSSIFKSASGSKSAQSKLIRELKRKLSESNRNIRLADKAFDADPLRQTLKARKAEAIIPAKQNRISHIPHDETDYKWRHLIENYFSKIKEFPGVNTRYDKTVSSYQATWNIAATIIALR